MRSFQIDIAILRALKNTTWDRRDWRIIGKKWRTHVLSALTLSALFCFIFSALFLKSAKFFRKLDENRWNTKLPSTHAQISEHLIWCQFGGTKAGTSRSHDVGRSELDYINYIYIIRINPSKLIRIRPKPWEKNKDLATSPEVRVVVETFFCLD